MRKSLAVGLGLLLIGGTVWAQQYLITTIAGGGLPPTSAPAVSAAIGEALAVATDAFGNVYFTANSVVFKVDASGVLTRVAGSSTRTGYSGDGGPAPSAQLANPPGVAVDGSGNIYIADFSNQRIREVAAATGIITTVAGNGTEGYSGDGGPATSAQLAYPWGVAVDGSGNLYIADEENNVIRKVAAATGIITTVAGNGMASYWGDGGPATSAELREPLGLAVDGSGNLYIVDTGNSVIRKVTAATGIITTVAGGGSASPGDGGPATSAELLWPESVAVDGSGNMYVADPAHGRIRKVTAATGIISTVAGNGTLGYSGDGGPATSAQFRWPLGVAVDGSGNLYIADARNCSIRRVASASGIIGTLAGDGTNYSGDEGPALSAQLWEPYGAAVDGSGNLYIADTDNDRIRRVAAATGIITTVAGNGTSGYSGDGGPATIAQVNGPLGVAVDGFGNLYFVDTSNNRIRRVAAATGVIATLAGNGNAGYSGDGGPATNAQLNGPSGVAVDGSGNLYIADSENEVVRKVSAATGIITTVAGNGAPGYSGDGGPATSARLHDPWGMAADGSGNLYIADSMNQRIREVAAATGIITTVAGGGSDPGDGRPAANAALFQPVGVALDGPGNLYIAQSGNNRIRKVMAATGVITTVAGNGGADGYSGDGGPATSAQFYNPSGVAVDAIGNVCIADASNNAIRMLVPVATRALLSIASTHSADFAPGQTAAAYSILVSNAVGAGATSGTVTATEIVPTGLTLVSTSGAGWNCSNATCARNDGLNPGTSYPPITVTVNVAENAPVQVLNQVTVSGGGAWPTSTSDLTTISGVLQVSSGGVVNAASYSMPVAPGSIAAVFGDFPLASGIPVTAFPIPTNLGGLSLQFGGAPLAPLFYANFGQVNAQVPWELAGQSQTTISTSVNSQNSVPETVSLATYAPGIFTVNGEGTGPGAILDSNYQLVSATNPTTAGANIQIYCTGLGPVSNQPATGAPSPLSPLASTPTWPTVTIGGVSATVQFSGLTPGDVGLYQVNAYVPKASPKGAAVPVVIAIGGATSNMVTIAVQ